MPTADLQREVWKTAPWVLTMQRMTLYTTNVPPVEFFWHLDATIAVHKWRTDGVVLMVRLEPPPEAALINGHVFYLGRQLAVRRERAAGRRDGFTRHWAKLLRVAHQGLITDTYVDWGAAPTNSSDCKFDRFVTDCVKRQREEQRRRPARETQPWTPLRQIEQQLFHVSCHEESHGQRRRLSNKRKRVSSSRRRPADHRRCSDPPPTQHLSEAIGTSFEGQTEHTWSGHTSDAGKNARRHNEESRRWSKRSRSPRRRQRSPSPIEDSYSRRNHSPLFQTSDSTECQQRRVSRVKCTYHF